MPIPESPSDSTPTEAEQQKNQRTPAMVLIPEGEFLMGTSSQQVLHLLQKEDWAKEWQEKNLFQVEQPQHKIVLPAYSIGAHPVTNAEYQVFVWETGGKVPKGWDGFRYPEELADHPVVQVSLEEAMAYCAWLSRELGKDFRLPTEAQWEKAARGTDGRMYPWGNEFDPWRCNTLESSKNNTTAIHSYSPAGDSPYKCSDMAGNVFEWTRSPLVPYPYGESAPFVKPDPAVKYAVRGGAWYYSRKLARCASREGMLASSVSPALGFRLASSSI